MSNSKSTYLYFFKIATIPIAVVGGIWLLAYYIYSQTDLMQEQQKQVSEVVHNTIQELANKDLLLPDIVFIQGDSAGQVALTDTLIFQISTALTRKYLKSDTTSFQDIDFHPYFVLPNKSDSVGNYILTQSQLNDLKNHLDFLTKQVDVEADKIKQEVGRDIDRLNTWVSIWIGILGFFGIFIPVFINYELRKDTEDAKIKSNTAKEKAEKALEAIENAKPEIKKVKELASKIGDLEGKLPDIVKQSNSAKTDAENARDNAKAANDSSKKNEAIISVSHSIALLKDLGATSLHIAPDKKAMLIAILEKVYAAFKNSNNHADHEIVIDAIRQLGLQLHYISLLKFSAFGQTEDLNDFSVFILDSLKEEMTKEKFDNVITKLNELMEKLKSV